MFPPIKVPLNIFPPLVEELSALARSCREVTELTNVTPDAAAAAAEGGEEEQLAALAIGEDIYSTEVQNFRT